VNHTYARHARRMSEIDAEFFALMAVEPAPEPFNPQRCVEFTPYEMATIQLRIAEEAERELERERRKFGNRLLTLVQRARLWWFHADPVWRAGQGLSKWRVGAAWALVYVAFMAYAVWISKGGR
jgi:hypothetical protein